MQCRAHWSPHTCRYPQVPLLALTATATPRVQHDVVQQLCLQDCLVFRSSFNRPNLRQAKRTEQHAPRMCKRIMCWVLIIGLDAPAAATDAQPAAAVVLGTGAHGDSVKQASTATTILFVRPPEQG